MFKLEMIYTSTLWRKGKPLSKYSHSTPSEEYLHQEKSWENVWKNTQFSKKNPCYFPVRDKYNMHV